MKKGQAALEYLLTYGWAILIVIIVGASLYALGIFTPGQWTGQRQTGFTAFNVVDFKMDNEANLTIIFENRIGKTVGLEDIDATFRGVDCVFDEVYVGEFLNTSETSGTISPGRRYWTTLDCGPDADLGASYSINVNFGYEDPESGLTHIDAGTLIGAVEPAQ